MFRPTIQDHNDALSAIGTIQRSPHWSEPKRDGTPLTPEQMAVINLNMVAGAYACNEASPISRKEFNMALDSA